MNYHQQQLFVSDNLSDYRYQQNNQAHLLQQYGSYYAGNLQQTQQKRTSKLNECDKTDVTHSSVQSESLCNNSTYVVEHLDLDNFKYQQCKITGQHNHKHCPFYHNSKDRKRIGHFYSSDMCNYMEKGENCPNGDECKMSHNRVEQLYQPEKYKTKFCTYYPNNIAQCDYGQFCSFAHSENDIVIELIHNLAYDDDFYMFYFKTVWCPFNLALHDKALCVYAHNWQDYRRKPGQFYYDPTSCSSWSPTNFITNYEDGCPQKFDCQKCHGWKELEYHPRNFKTKPCPNQKPCSKQNDCPFYHAGSRLDKRMINQHIQNKIFKYVPKNRIITNTFKVRNADQSYGSNQGLQQQMCQTPSQIQIYPSQQISKHNFESQNGSGFKGTSSMITLSSNQKTQNIQQWNPHNSQQVYYHQMQNIQKQISPPFYMPPPQQGHFVQNQQIIFDNSPPIDSRLKLSKKKKEGPGSNLSSLNSNNNNNINTNTNSNANANSNYKYPKDSNDSEIWLGKGGSKTIEDSFEIEPQSSGGKEQELSGSQTLLQDCYQGSSKCPFSGQKDQQHQSDSCIPILPEFNSYLKEAAENNHQSSESAFSQQQQIVTDQMFKDLVSNHPPNQKISCDYTHDVSMSKRDEELERDVLNIVDD